MSILKKIYDYFEEGMCAVMLGTMILCLSAQVVIRMTIGSSIAWTEELSRYPCLSSRKVLNSPKCRPPCILPRPGWNSSSP